MQSLTSLCIVITDTKRKLQRMFFHYYFPHWHFPDLLHTTAGVVGLGGKNQDWKNHGTLKTANRARIRATRTMCSSTYPGWTFPAETGRAWTWWLWRFPEEWGQYTGDQTSSPNCSYKRQLLNCSQGFRMKLVRWHARAWRQLQNLPCQSWRGLDYLLSRWSRRIWGHLWYFWSCAICLKSKNVRDVIREYTSDGV